MIPSFSGNNYLLRKLINPLFNLSAIFCRERKFFAGFRLVYEYVVILYDHIGYFKFGVSRLKTTVLNQFPYCSKREIITGIQYLFKQRVVLAY